MVAGVKSYIRESVDSSWESRNHMLQPGQGLCIADHEHEWLTDQTHCRAYGMFAGDIRCINVPGIGTRQAVFISYDGKELKAQTTASNASWRFQSRGFSGANRAQDTRLYTGDELLVGVLPKSASSYTDKPLIKFEIKGNVVWEAHAISTHTENDPVQNGINAARLLAKKFRSLSWDDDTRYSPAYLALMVHALIATDLEGLPRAVRNEPLIKEIIGDVPTLSGSAAYSNLLKQVLKVDKSIEKDIVDALTILGITRPEGSKVMFGEWGAKLLERHVLPLDVLKEQAAGLAQVILGADAEHVWAIREAKKHGRSLKGNQATLPEGTEEHLHAFSVMMQESMGSKTPGTETMLACWRAARALLGQPLLDRIVPDGYTPAGVQQKLLPILRKAFQAGKRA